MKKKKIVESEIELIRINRVSNGRFRVYLDPTLTCEGFDPQVILRVCRVLTRTRDILSDFVVEED